MISFCCKFYCCVKKSTFKNMFKFPWLVLKVDSDCGSESYYKFPPKYKNMLDSIDMHSYGFFALTCKESQIDGFKCIILEDKLWVCPMINCDEEMLNYKCEKAKFINPFYHQYDIPRDVVKVNECDFSYYVFLHH